MKQLFVLSVVLQILSVKVTHVPTPGFSFLFGLGIVYHVIALSLRPGRTFSLRPRLAVVFPIAALLMTAIASFLLNIYDVPQAFYERLILPSLSLVLGIVEGPNQERSRAWTMFYAISLLIILVSGFTSLAEEYYFVGNFAFGLWQDGALLLTYQQYSLAIVFCVLGMSKAFRNKIPVFLSGAVLTLIAGSRSTSVSYVLGFLASGKRIKINYPLVAVTILLLVAIVTYINQIEAIRLFDLGSVFERYAFTLYYFENFKSPLFGAFAHDWILRHEPGSYAHNVLDFLFAYGIIGLVLTCYLYYLSIVISLNKVDVVAMVLIVYSIFFGQNLFFGIWYVWGTMVFKYPAATQNQRRRRNLGLAVR